MNKLLTLILGLAIMAALTSCKDDESYADQKKKERKAVDAFLQRAPLILIGANNDTLLYSGKINVITQEQFEAQDSMTDVAKNEYVYFGNTGIYMQIVRKGPGEKIKHGDTRRVICRYWEYNIIGDSLQSTDLVPYYATNPEIMDVYNNSGTITASFNTENGGGGAMAITYNSTVVPNGWIVPLTYVNLGRQNSPDEGIALVRILVPHSQGTADATSNVYPCFYEVSYQEL